MASALERKLDEALADHQAGRYAQAEAAYRKVLAQQPHHADALHFLGLLLHQGGRGGEGIELMQRAVRLGPNSAMYHYNLGNALREQLRYDEAIESLRRATALDSRLVDAWVQLGNCLRAQAKLDEAIGAFEKVAMADSVAYSNLLYTLWLHPKFEVGAIVNEHRRWAQQMADPLTAKAPPHENDRDPERRIRVGYISQDFWKHVLGRFIEPILGRHDHRRFEVLCYSDALREDEVTSRIRSAADQWRPTRGMPHERVAQMIRDDRIDVLVDLAAHSGINRLAVLARKPAPVQVTYLGYPATTGMKAMDYRISDVHLDPPGETEAWHTEKLIRLPGCYWGYPVPPAAPDVGALPAIRNGYVVFGSCNSSSKMNAQTIQLWGRILARLPSSRLRVAVPGGVENNRHVMGMFTSNGVPADRVDAVPTRPYGEYLRMYHEIDVSLDSFPYNGGATSLDAAFMGVPVVTLTGPSMVSRGGVTVLKNLGLPELIASSPQEYEEIAVGLAGNVERLKKLRAELRDRMMASPLVDIQRLTSGLEEAYRRIWRRWCEGRGAESFAV